MSASGNEILTLNQFLSEETGSKVTDFPNLVPTIGQIINYKNGLYDFKIPEKYSRLEYIESSENGPYIDTGFKPNQDTRVVLDLYSYNNIGECHVFGCRTAMGSTSYAVIIDSNTTWRSDYNLSRKTLGNGYRSGTIRIDMNKNSTSINDYKVTHSQQTFSVPYSLYLLALNTSGSTTTFCKAKIIKCDIYDNGILVRRFIPCQNLENGSVGLYDLINDKFYENAGSGSFKAGPQYRSRSIVEDIPEGYTQIDYIQSDGSGQYIDSEFIPDPANSSIVMDAELYTDCTDKHFIGCRHTLSSKAFALMITSSSKWRSDYNDSKIQFSTPPKNGRLGLVINSSDAKVGNELISRTVSNFTLNYPAYIFAVNTGGSTSTFAPIRVYSVQMYKNNDMVRNFIPCIQNSNGEIGLYDLVQNKFYSNSGTGTFIAGPDTKLKKYPITISQYKKVKTKTYIKLEYISLDGKQFVETNYHPNNNTRIIADVYLDSSQLEETVAIYGGRTRRDGETQSFTLWILSANQFRFDFNKENLTINMPTAGRFNIDCNKNVIKINSSTFTASNAEFKSSHTLKIASTWTDAGSNYNDSNYNDLRRFKGKLYYVKIYDNGTLVRDYVPVKRISDGAIGLYDKVNKLFYGNDGTGSFGAGPEVGYI